MSPEWQNLESEPLLEHFGLSREPFNITPDPSFLYLSASHQQALTRLLYGISARKGFVVLTGEIGTGKTTLIHTLLQELKKRNTQSTLIVNTINHSKDLLRDVCEDLGFTAFREDRQNIHTYLKLLNQLLLESYHKGKNVTLIIDEAQNLSTAVLENIRLLSNFETSQDKLLQIVLAGQSELAARLNSPELRQLKQRIVLYHHLKPLNFGECAEYIAKRLEIAGATRSIFTPEALQAICNYSGGIPRLINILCDNGLLTAYGLGGKRVRAEMIREIAEDRGLTFQSEQASVKARLSMQVERHADVGPPTQGSAQLDDLTGKTDAEQFRSPQLSIEETPTVSAEETTDALSALAERIEIEREGRTIPPALVSTPLDVDAGEVEREQLRVMQPSAEESPMVEAEDTADALAALAQRIEIERQRHLGLSAPGSARFDRAAADDSERLRVTEPSVDEPPVAVIGGRPKTPSASTKTARDVVSTRFLDYLIGSLTEAMGPMAPLVIRDQVSALGEQLEAFPKSRVAELVESASQEILDEPLRIRFQQVLSQQIRTMNSSREEK